MVAAAPAASCASTSADAASRPQQRDVPVDDHDGAGRRSPAASTATRAAWPVPRCSACSTGTASGAISARCAVSWSAPWPTTTTRAVGLERPTRRQHVAEQGPAEQRVQHLGQVGLHPLALARGEHDHGPFVGHCALLPHVDRTTHASQPRPRRPSLVLRPPLAPGRRANTLRAWVSVARSLIIGSTVLGAAGGVGGWALLADARPGARPVRRSTRCSAGATSPARRPRPSPGSWSAPRSSPTTASAASATCWPTRRRRRPAPACRSAWSCTAAATTTGRPFDGLRLPPAAGRGGRRPGCRRSCWPRSTAASAYWHPRAGGDDPLGMLLEDFPVVLAPARAADARRSACSATRWAGTAHCWPRPRRRSGSSAVVASAPAVWLSYDDAHGGEPGRVRLRGGLAEVGRPAPAYRQPCRACRYGSTAASPTRSRRP